MSLVALLEKFRGTAGYADVPYPSEGEALSGLSLPGVGTTSFSLRENSLSTVPGCYQIFNRADLVSFDVDVEVGFASESGTELTEVVTWPAGVMLVPGIGIFRRLCVRVVPDLTSRYYFLRMADRSTLFEIPEVAALRCPPGQGACK